MKRLGLFVSLMTVAFLLAACATPTPEVVERLVEKEVTREVEKIVEKVVTQVVKETVKETVVVEGTPQIVEKEVTKIVEQVVTATPEPEDTSKYGGTLIIKASGLVQFDPIFIADDASFHVVSNVYSLLFRRQEPDIYPDLATSWEYEDDTTLIFYLRQGVMWHDDNAVFAKGQSREVVADDVVYSIKRAVETEGAATAADLLASFESIEALDDYTVKLTLKAPDALLFSGGRGLSWVPIVPREAVEQLGEDFALNPIGSGPFKFVEYLPDESLTLERNDLYWQKPYLDKVVYRVIPDEDAALISFEAGEVDILDRVPAAEFDRLQADNRYILLPANCPYQVWMMFNMTNPLLSQLELRKAVAYALDGDAIAANVHGGMYVGGCGTAGPGVPGYDPTLCNKYFPYDPEGARAILKEIGWEDTDGDGVLDKDGQPLEFPLEIWSMDPMPKFGAAIVTQLAEAGIQVDLQTVEFGTWIDDFFSGVDKAMMASGFCGDGGLTSLWGRDFAGNLNYDDEEIFELLERSNTIVDPAERDKVLREAQDKIYGQYWAVPTGFATNFSAARSWVHDFYGTLGSENLCTEFNNVWVKK